MLGGGVFVKCVEEDSGYGAGNIARERRRIPGDVAGSTVLFSVTGARWYKIYVIAETASGKSVIITVCRVVEDGFVGGQIGDSDRNIFDKVLEDKLRVAGGYMYVVKSLVGYVVRVV